MKNAPGSLVLRQCFRPYCVQFNDISRTKYLKLEKRLTGYSLYHMIFWFTFQLTLCSYYFYNLQKTVLGPNRLYINMFHIILRNVCLLSVVCSAYAVYTILYRGLKYLLEVSYIILNYPNVARFFQTFCLDSSKTLTYV